MEQVLDLLGLAPEAFNRVSGKAKESLSRPGVPVKIPRAIVEQIEGSLQDKLTGELLWLREKERNASHETLKLRIR